MALIFLACTDYGLVPEADAPEPLAEDPWVDTGSYEDPEIEDPDCSLFPTTWAWDASDMIWQTDDPEDDSGLPFWEPQFDGTFTAITVPDAHQVPAGADRAYRTTFELDVVPPRVEVDVQSDDGLWLWVNGAEIGHWGGDWQEEGCVNDEANCLEFVEIDPVDITQWLVEGDNLVAARVSNAIEGSWFDLIPACTD